MSSPMSSPSLAARVGASVRKFRSRLGLSQTALGQRADLHRSYIADIERGARNVTLRSMERLARALEVSLVDLLIHAGQRATPPERGRSKILSQRNLPRKR